MKKVLLFCVILFFGIFFVALVKGTFYEKDKATKEIYKELNKKGKAEVIVKIKKSENKIDTKLNKANYEKKSKILNRTIREYRNFKILNVTEEEFEILKNLSEVEKIEKLYYVKAMLQDSVNIVNASMVWPLQEKEMNLTGTGETICVLDTGINYTHPDLIGKNKTCIIDCFEKECVENCSLGDDNGHGTQVAGILAACGGIKGIAPNVSFIGLKVLNSSGDGDSLGLLSAIWWCIENRNKYNISVITMSLGTTTPNLYEEYCDEEWTDFTEAVNEATFKNISVIASSGNEGNRYSISWPACISNVSAVGSTNKDDSVASYSNFNRITDFFAPGTNIKSTDGTNGYGFNSGTSMSTPHVAAAFAIIKQFYYLQKNKILTPKQIENVLKQKGKNITTSTEIKIPRINIYNAIISLDDIAPNVNLIFPSNGNGNFEVLDKFTFRCNATDLSLKNISFYLWNSSSVFNYSFKEISGAKYNYEINISELKRGDYKWNCYFVDENNNVGFFATNYSFKILKNISVELISPFNEISSKENQTFVCNADSVNELKNVSFYLWNESSLEYGQQKDISGRENSVTFYYNFTREGNYLWNCYFVDEFNYGISNALNFSFGYDLTAPNVTLIKPADDYSETASSTNILFEYNARDNLNISNCSLIINNEIASTNNLINQFTTQNFTKTIGSGNYIWSINCTDKAGNVGNSSLKRIIINTPATNSGGGGGGSVGGGGSAQITNIFYPSNEELVAGYNKGLKKDEKIKFYDSSLKEHILKIRGVGKDYVNLSIESEQIFISLKIKESIKLNLTSSEYYEIYLELQDIQKDKALLFVKLIKEKMFEEKKEILSDEIKIDDTEKIEKLKNDKTEMKKNFVLKMILRFILIIIVLFILFYILDLKKVKKRKSRKK